MDIDPYQCEQVVIKDNDIHNIYPVHNCYKETVESFIASTVLKQPDAYSESMETRKCIKEALEFAQTKLALFGKVQKYVEKIEDFKALLVFEEPEKSPVFRLLRFDYRQHIVDNLNRAILAMERLIQQTALVRQYLNQEKGKDASSSFSLKDFLKG